MTAPAQTIVVLGGQVLRVGGRYFPVDPPVVSNHVEVARFSGNVTPPATPAAHVDIAKVSGAVTAPSTDPPPTSGSFVPDSQNVGLFGSLYGLPAGTTLTEDNRIYPRIVGSSDPNNPTVIELTRFHSTLHIASGYVDVVRCDLAAIPDSTTAKRPALQANEAATVRVFDSDIHIDVSNNANWPVDPLWQVGAVVNNTTMIRCRIFDSCDGINTTTGGVTIRDTWIGAQLYFSPDPARKAAGDTPPYYMNHADPIQIANSGVANMLIVNSTLEGFNDMVVGLPAGSQTGAYGVGQANVPDNNAEGSCLGYNPPTTRSVCNSALTWNLKANHTNIVFDGVHFRGGRASVNVGGAAPPAGSGLSFLNCVFDRTAHTKAFIVANNVRAAFTITNPRYEDGTPVTVAASS